MWGVGLFLSECQCVPHGEDLSGSLTHRPVVFSLLLSGHVFTCQTEIVNFEIKFIIK